MEESQTLHGREEYRLYSFYLRRSHHRPIKLNVVRDDYKKKIKIPASGQMHTPIISPVTAGQKFLKKPNPTAYRSVTERSKRHRQQEMEAHTQISGQDFSGEDGCRTRHRKLISKGVTMTLVLEILFNSSLYIQKLLSFCREIQKMCCPVAFSFPSHTHTQEIKNRHY
jgi:hypothetical protein